MKTQIASDKIQDNSVFTITTPHASSQTAAAASKATLNTKIPMDMSNSYHYQMMKRLRKSPPQALLITMPISINTLEISFIISSRRKTKKCQGRDNK